MTGGKSDGRKTMHGITYLAAAPKSVLNSEESTKTENCASDRTAGTFIGAVIAFHLRNAAIFTQQVERWRVVARNINSFACWLFAWDHS